MTDIQGRTMIVGTFINNYKIYRNATFLPFIKSTDHKLSIFIGKNGAGKSSILEALDTVFNNREWNPNIHSKKTEAFICPIFLIPKPPTRTNKTLDAISNYFWNYKTPDQKSAINYDIWKEFIAFREVLKNNINTDEFYLLVIGLDEQRGLSYTSTHKKLLYTLKDKGISINEQVKALNLVLGRYAYIYLPIHSTPAELLNLKSKELQVLLDKNLIREIEQILTRDDENHANPIKSINNKLDQFLEDINSNLQDMDGSYQYKNAFHSKITASDITETIINNYISKKPLQKDNKPIQNLSSGEQRVAIIDVAHAFLSKNLETIKELVIAIDEPEVSLSPVHCLNQFKRIFNLSHAFKKQVLVSTHWYGLLMTPTEATLNHISGEGEKPVLQSLNLSKIQEERRNFPDAFEMKSYFDLVSSILSIVKGNSQNWIICEGNDDSNYLKTIISEKVENLNILPVGGRGAVKKIFEYMRIAAEDKAERVLITGKILCIIDSDPELVNISNTTREAQKILKILRFQNTKDGFADLIPAASAGFYTETELEDTLDPQDFYNAAKHIVKSQAPEEIKQAYLEGGANTKAKFSGINYDLDFLALRKEDYYLKSDIKNFFLQDHVKSDISKRYAANHTTPKWAETIEAFFSKKEEL